VRNRGILVPAALAVAFGAAAVALGRAAEAARAPEARAAGGLPPLGIVNVLAVDLLWLRADGLFATNRWPEMNAAYEMAGRAEPRLAAAFEYRGFHLAYNLAGNAASPEDRDRWVIEGIQVLSDGLERNPSSGDLRAWLGHALFERTQRWPSLRPKLKAKRGRDPWDEAADHLGAAVKAEPDFGRAVIWLTDVLEARGLGCGRADAARADFRRAAEAIRRLKALLRDLDPKPLEDLAIHFDNLERDAGK
jgi:tetratricopeptide (TPR) repeat protein